MSYLDSLTEPRSNPVKTETARPAFGRRSFGQLLESGGIGFYPTSGFHIYCELRPTTKLEVAESEQKALKYVRVLEEFVNHGARAAAPFNVVLLEVQGNVLHFYKEAPLTKDSLIAAIQFVYLFTNSLYEELKPELGDEWDGFASCMDHGPSVIVRHESFSSSSSVSLGPCANAPAKRLLYGKTPAAAVDVPGGWANLLSASSWPSWFTINLRDRTRIPFIELIENRHLRDELVATIQAYRRDPQRSQFKSVGLLESRVLFGSSGFNITAPQRVQAFCLRADLDGFSAIVKQAFDSGEKAVETVAIGFAKILEFGQYMERSTPGSIRLPWAGDCATLLVPNTPDAGELSVPRWLDVTMRWQSFGGGTSEAVQRGWANLFQKVRWSVGACHGQAGMNIVAPIQAQARTFLVGAGWPVAMSLDAQNLGKGGDVLTHSVDYQALAPVPKKLFSKVPGTDFWKATDVTKDKITQAAVEVAATSKPRGEDYLAKYQSIQVPSSRPHCK